MKKQMIRRPIIKKQEEKKVTGITGTIFAAVLSLSLIAAGSITAMGESAVSRETEEMRSSLEMNVDGNGKLSIKRQVRAQEKQMGEDGTWTIFVYMCGSDLESEGAYATADLEEMKQSSIGDGRQFVVQTGGAASWDNEVDASMSQRYVIADGEMQLVDEEPAENMGESKTLTDFLSWGIEQYPAEHMGVVFWNHGGGSISGVCFDEQNDQDSLSLREIDAALLGVFDRMTDKFDFIGFDACLMATVESAGILATYADYMYASEETEAGSGWDYEAIGNFLAENPDADGKELGIAVTDSFYAACEESWDDYDMTFSVVDLSKIDKVLVSFNEFGKNLYEAAEDRSVMSEIARNALQTENFGGNNKSEGYTNMVDLEGLVMAGAEYAEGAQAVKDALADAVVYMKNGEMHKSSCGLSTYYPIQVQGSSELKMFGEIAVSPYYLSFVDRIAYGLTNSGDTDDYDNSEVMDFWGVLEYLFLDDYYENDEEAYEAENSYWSSYGDCAQSGESTLISFENGPEIDEDGNYSFTLTEEALDNAASVQANVYMLSDDQEDMIELGISADIEMDWYEGHFSSIFDGLWFSLPDGQNLAIYLVEEDDGYDVYTSPVMVNGSRTNLRIIHDYENDEITLDGTWDGIDECGMSGRETEALEEGDEIIPVYYAEAIDSDEQFDYYGESYVFDGEPELYYDYLPDGDYVYGFFIDDCFGDYYATDYVGFTIDGENVDYFVM